MTETDKLRESIRNYQSAVMALENATDVMRAAIRLYLRAKTEKHGSTVTLARKLGISSAQLSNLKRGYAIASAEWAQKAMRVCGDFRKDKNA